MKERKALSDKLVSLSEERTVAANYKNYSVVKEECLLREEAYFQKKNAFAGDIPSDAEIQECSDILRKAEEKKLQNEILERDIASLKNDINTLEDRKQEGEKALGQKEDALSRMKDKNPFEVYSKSDERDGNNETDEFAEMPDLKISKTSSLFFAAAGIFLLGGVILVLINFIMNRNLLILGGGIVCFIIGLVLFILGSMRKKKEHALILSAERKLAKEREAAAFKKQEKLLNAENDRKLLQTEIKGYEERIAADKEKIRLKIETIEQNSVEIGEIEKNVREFSVKTNGANIELSDYEEIHAFIQKIGISLSELRLAEKEYLAAEEKKQIFLTEHPEYMQFEEGRSVPAEEEIGKAVQTCIDAGNHRIAILKCLSEYPADPSAMNLRTIPHMMDTFHIPVGLSDHSPGSVSDVAAVALGARVIEKHLMLPGVESADSAFSMSPEEFSRMVSDVRTAVKALGRVSYGCSGKETTELRRSLFASRDIKKGELFTEENVKSVRPSCGLPPECMDQLINKAARRDIPFGAPLEKGDLEGL